MRRSLLLLIFLSFSWMNLQAQTPSASVPDPSVNDFEGILSFLSSDWMEGREAATRGGFMAADYIASVMQTNGLRPYGDTDKSKHTYFQNFNVIRYQVEKSALAYMQHSQEGESALWLTQGIDYNINPVPFSRESIAPVVFAGYGIESPANGYDDYRGIDVNHRIVAIIDGFPGHADTNSPAWKKIGKTFTENFTSTSKKLRIAEKHGAVAVIILNQDLIINALNSPKPAEADYDDPEYYLPGDTSIVKIPCFRLGKDATWLLLYGTSTDLQGFEKKAALDLTTASAMLQGKKLRLSVAVKQEPMAVRNVMGIIYGKDSTKNLLVGAHYDHLGIRKGMTFNGADDNASGVSGMLALSRIWADLTEKPSCNIIFTAWTAEEKGLLGSDYFARHSLLIPDRLSMVINLDMISRSASDDTARCAICIGTLPDNENLRKIARNSNAQLKHPFTLDLWDVTGHTGSDYSPFAARKIPVMTFFSGFHEDYHSPRDVFSKTDPEKMEKILKIVNDCLGEFALNPGIK